MKRSGLSVGLLLITGFLATSAFLVYVRFASLPHPSEASHNQLMYWVVLRDLKQFEPEIHLALVNRFSEEAKDIFKKNNASKANLSDSQTERLLDNIELLKKVWFEDRVSTYCDINHPETCERFMNQQIQLLDDFGNIAFEHASVLYPDKTDEKLTTISDELFGDIDRWLTDTPGSRKKQTLQAVREATVFWLATQDLALQVMSARKELVSRVILELEKGMDLKQTTSIVGPSRDEQLRENALLLMEAWVHLLADEYAELPKEEKISFVDGKIDAVKRWNLLEYLMGEPQSASPPEGEGDLQKSPANSEPAPRPASSLSLNTFTKFNQTVQGWIERAEADLKPKIKKLHAAIQQRIFVALLKQQD